MTFYYWVTTAKITSYQYEFQIYRYNLILKCVSLLFVKLTKTWIFTQCTLELKISITNFKMCLLTLTDMNFK